MTFANPVVRSNVCPGRMDAGPVSVDSDKAGVTVTVAFALTDVPLQSLGLQRRLAVRKNLGSCCPMLQPLGP